jgi:hypothetical protein
LEPPSREESERCRLERDLYWRLLEPGTREALGPLLEEALSLCVEVTGAKKGYLALSPDEEERGAPSFAITRGLSAEDAEGVREEISRGIIA